MKNRIYLQVICVAVLLSAILLIAPVQPAKAQFVLSEWDFPDGFGQGIDTITVQENSTGSWLNVGNFDYDEDSTLNWTAGVAIKLKCWTWFNSTLTGAVSSNDGKNYQRHNVTVTNYGGSTIFSQQNFTYSNAYTEADPMWYYVYNVVLEFLPTHWQFYTVTVTYEIFYQGMFY